MSVERPLADAADQPLQARDLASRRWVERLRPGHPRQSLAAAGHPLTGDEARA